MIPIRSLLAAAGFALLVGCTANASPLGPEPEPSPSAASVRSPVNNPFRLRVGEVALVDVPDGSALLVAFSGVKADSRCPTEALVLCAWEGDAEAVIGVTRARRAWDWHTLHTTLDPKAVVFGNVTVRLVELAPAKRTLDPIDPSSYVVTLVAERR